MLQLIKSQKIDLPPIYLVENQADLDQLPKGIPYVIGNEKELKFITIFLEFQILLRSCNKTGLPVKWEKCLQTLGYTNTIRPFTLSSGGSYYESSEGRTELELDEFIEGQYLVDLDRLSELKLLPTWLEDIKASIQTNIIDEMIFDPTAFNKQLGLQTGAGTVKHNPRNLLILDVSSTMPTSIVIATTGLAKLMSKKFYADIIVTGGKSFFIDYDDMENSDVVETARIAGRSNESEMFRKIVKENKVYGTIISFGDDDNPGEGFDCNFKCENLYSLHTENNSDNITGYAKCFKPTNVVKVKNWVKTLA